MGCVFSGFPENPVSVFNESGRCRCGCGCGCGCALCYRDKERCAL